MHRCLHHARTVRTISSLARSCASMLDVTPGLLVDNSWDHILINLSLLIHSWAHYDGSIPKDLPHKIINCRLNHRRHSWNLLQHL